MLDGKVGSNGSSLEIHKLEIPENRDAYDHDDDGHDRGFEEAQNSGNRVLNASDLSGMTSEQQRLINTQSDIRQSDPGNSHGK